MPIEVKTDGEYLFFEDYLKREIKIKQDDYLELISNEQRRKIRPALEECLKHPTEVWTDVETVEETDYVYSKYLKFYSNFVFVALVIINDGVHLTLNNFYGYNEEEEQQVEKERVGKLVYSQYK